MRLEGFAITIIRNQQLDPKNAYGYCDGSGDYTYFASTKEMAERLLGDADPKANPDMKVVPATLILAEDRTERWIRTVEEMREAGCAVQVLSPNNFKIFSEGARFGQARMIEDIMLTEARKILEAYGSVEEE